MILRKRRRIRDKQSRRLHAKYDRLNDGQGQQQGQQQRSRDYGGEDDDTFELQALNEMDYENPDI